MKSMSAECNLVSYKNNPKVDIMVKITYNFKFFSFTKLKKLAL